MPTNGKINFKWWSENRTKIVCFVALNVQYSNVPSYHVIRPLKNQTKKCLKSQMLGVWYSDGYCTSVLLVGLLEFKTVGKHCAVGEL